MENKMDEEIKKLGEIVESTYKKEPTGTVIYRRNI